MALTDAQKITLTDIFEVTYIQVDWQINYIGVLLTPAKEAALGALITSWTGGIGSKTTKLFPVGENKGVKTDPDAARTQIRRQAAMILERPEWGRGGGSYLQRG